MIGSMPRVCAWDRSDEMPSLLFDRYVSWLRQEQSGVLLDIEKASPTVGECLRRIFAALPEPSIRRLITAPETCFRLRAHMADDVSFLRETLIAERKLIGGESDVQRGWSALGDFYFAENTAIDPCKQYWQPDCGFQAPRIGTSIPLDFVSPYAQAVQPMRYPFEPYTPQEILLVWRKMEETFQKIAAVSQNAALLIQGFVKVVILRKDFPQIMGSTSTMPTYIGRVLIRNAANMNPANLADGLVRETIHAVLSMIAVFTPLVSDEAAASRTMVRSPWSRAMLSLQSYMYASFAAYGLAKFWRAALLSKAFSAQEANELLTKALAGFRGPNPASKLAVHARMIDPEALNVTYSLWQELQLSGDLAGPPENR